MGDMLVRLWELPELQPVLARMGSAGVVVRRALAPEKAVVVGWVRARFPAWVSEVEVAMAHLPASCFVAVRDGAVVGFACHDAICRNFFGPAGVEESQRGRGIGTALLLAALHAQQARGYAYAIIGGIGPAEFYTKVVGATPIERSQPGIYDGLVSG